MNEIANSAIASGIDLSWVDPTVRPQDDLFEHVNGKWLREFEIPADRPLDGAFHVLRDRAEEHVRDLIINANPSSGPEAQKIADLYASFMDEPQINSLGASPLAAYFTKIDSATTADELAAVLGYLQRNGSSGLLSYYVDTDAKKSDRYLVHLSQSGLGLPDESYYREEKYAEVRGHYASHIEAMLKLFEIAPGAEIIVELETEIARCHVDVVRRRDAEASYNLKTFTQLSKELGSFSLAQWADGLASREAMAEIVVKQPEFIAGIANLYGSQPLSTWKLWAKWQLICTFAPYLTTEIVNQNFSFYGKTLSGTEEIRERWKRGVQVVEGALGFAVGKLYVAEHFPPVAKTRMDELIANLVAAYRNNIAQLDWMSPETREKALVKLAKFTPKIGYPAQWRDYSPLRIERNDLLGNVIRASLFDHDREISKIGKPIDRDEWFMTPQTVNAYYNPGMNEIVFPAAILQPPFFDPAADDAANYGGIGAVIGHEIGHGFDDQGAKYDGDGNLNNWWTESDQAEFSLRTKKLIAQYDSFTPKGLDAAEHRVNGSFTIGENIGDLGGLSISLAAYKIALGNSAAPIIDGFTGLQRVFFGWAQVWRTKTRTAEAIKRLSIDPHSPPEFRCNGVISNIDDFYTAFEVTESDALYLKPEERVHIW